MIRSLVYIIILGAGLSACSSALYIEATATKIEVSSDDGQANRIDSLVAPFRSEMEAEMNFVIGTSKHEFVKDRPNSALNNWAADALFAYFKDSLDDSFSLVTLLNVGGLRSTFNIGDITIGDVFKMMPFDNEVVLVQMPRSSLNEIAAYLMASGGEPISGMHYQEGNLYLIEDIGGDSFYIATSDYLYNGGDKMTFFKNAINVKNTGILLRDVFIHTVKEQKELLYNSEKRIVLE